MPRKIDTKLSARERQIMDVIYQAGQATVTEVRQQMHEPPGYSSVRTFMNILEDKGHLTHKQDGRRYVYRPTRPRRAAGRSVLRHVLETFYGGSVESVVAALLDVTGSKLTEQDLDRLAEMIEEAKQQESSS